MVCTIVYARYNKRALGSWVNHLRMAVYTGIKKHSSSQSLATDLDRSAVSFKLYMEKFPVTILTELTGCRPAGPHGHNVNKHGRGPLADTTYQISRL